MSQENPENIQENPAPEPEPEPEPVSQTEPKPEPTPASQPEPAPKRRGRPEGAKDRAPRKKNVVVVEEDIQAPQNTPEPEAAVQAPTVQTPTPPVQTPEPDSPRTLIRHAADHILKLKNVTKMARKAQLQDEYTKRLHSLS